MPRGNERNLRTPTPEQARENGRKGGIASAKARKERKTIQTILNDFLNQNVNDVESVKKLASKLGLHEENSVKDLFSLVSIMNSLKKADLSELEKLARLLGEETNEITGTLNITIKDAGTNEH